MSNTPVVPYQGPAATPNTFATAFPEVAALVEGKAKRGVTYLDPLSLKRLDDLRRQMMSSPPAHATVVNLLPWELSFSSGMPLLRGLQVPACHPGMPYAYYHIRSWRHTSELMSDDTGSWSFSAITPIMQAGQFVREFLNKDNMGCGVIIYEGGQEAGKSEWPYGFAEIAGLAAKHRWILNVFREAEHPERKRSRRRSSRDTADQRT
jgi:hypothetical protein